MPEYSITTRILVNLAHTIGARAIPTYYLLWDSYTEQEEFHLGRAASRLQCDRMTVSNHLKRIEEANLCRLDRGRKSSSPRIKTIIGPDLVGAFTTTTHFKNHLATTAT